MVLHAALNNFPDEKSSTASWLSCCQIIFPSLRIYQVELQFQLNSKKLALELAEVNWSQYYLL